jgi:mRNA interferase MazF
MAAYKPGDVVLLDFPFAGGGATKRRPALVIVDTGDSDVLAARITSQDARDEFDIQLVDWKAAGLMLPSIVRVQSWQRWRKV